MSAEQKRVIQVIAWGSAYPGSMFDRKDGDYVSRHDAPSLAAALLEMIDTGERAASDAEDALKDEREISARLTAKRDQLLALLHEAIDRGLTGDEWADRVRAAITECQQ